MNNLKKEDLEELKNEENSFAFLGAIEAMSKYRYNHALDADEIELLCEIYKLNFKIATKKPFMNKALFLFVKTLPYLEDLAQYGISIRTFDYFYQCEKYIVDGIEEYIKNN